MTDTVKLVYCQDCNIEVRHQETCPECGKGELATLDKNVPKMYTMETVRQHISAAINMADGYITSKYRCFKCEHPHYMIWPGVRSETNYSVVEPLLTLPRCPIDLWRGSGTIAFTGNLEDFLRSLEVKDG